jgi:hypothetical protein
MRWLARRQPGVPWYEVWMFPIMVVAGLAALSRHHGVAQRTHYL